MESKGLIDIDRGMYGAVNPFLGYHHQVKNQYSIPYQFPAASENNPALFSLGGGTFDHQGISDPAHNFGLKFGNSGYGNTGLGTQTHYGPPIMPMGGGKGKLKGAALSALTLLAFLFFLNLLQSCLKDQMEAMNPTVMVMSAGQRAVLARNEEKEAKKRFDQNYDNPPHSDEQQHFNDYSDDVDYDMEEDERALGTTTTAKSYKRIRGKYKNDKRHKSKSLSSSTSLSSTIGPKLQNLQLVRNSMEG